MGILEYIEFVVCKFRLSNIILILEGINVKKLITFMLLATMTLSLSACGSKDSKAQNGGAKTIQSEEAKNGFGGLKEVPKFKVKDIDDKEVTNDIFKDKKLTMINVWGTFCGPCVEEKCLHFRSYIKSMEEKGVNILGVVADGDENEVQALQILQKKKVEFVNLIPDEKFKEAFVSRTKVVPVSLIVNSKGEIMDTVVGSMDKEGYKKVYRKKS